MMKDIVLVAAISIVLVGLFFSFIGIPNTEDFLKFLYCTLLIAFTIRMTPVLLNS